MNYQTLFNTIKDLYDISANESEMIEIVNSVNKDAQCQADNAEHDRERKLIHQLFIGKVVDEIGQEKTTALLKESQEAITSLNK